jgi:hypothetical protein
LESSESFETESDLSSEASNRNFIIDDEKMPQKK